ncbi:MAG TPA: hypothetical protein VI585_29085 [Candidatus Binatia bacterium]
MRFLQNMIRYDLGNAVAPLAIGVEFDRPFERPLEKEAKIVRKLAYEAWDDGDRIYPSPLTATRLS